MSAWISVKDRLPDPKKRFWDLTKDKIPEAIKYSNVNGCFVPINYKIGPTGYVSIKRFGFARMHRMIFYIHNHEGLTPNEWLKKHDRAVIMHKCDNRACINPCHLKIGTQIDNIQDRVNKGRCAYHEKNGNTKLTEKDVEFIRYYHKKKTIRQLCDFFNLNRRTVERIVTYEEWKKLPEAPKG